MDTQECRKCGETKPLDEFGKTKPIRGKYEYYRKQCKACQNARSREYHANNREAMKLRQVKYRHEVQHGLGPGGYDKMLADQNGGCALCGTTDPSPNKYFAVDHDHSHCPGKWGCAECVRGLLCNKCNHGLGNFKDNPELMRKAADYVAIRLV